MHKLFKTHRTCSVCVWSHRTDTRQSHFCSIERIRLATESQSVLVWQRQRPHWSTICQHHRVKNQANGIDRIAIEWRTMPTNIETEQLKTISFGIFEIEFWTICVVVSFTTKFKKSFFSILFYFFNLFLSSVIVSPDRRTSNTSNLLSQSFILAEPTWVCMVYVRIHIVTQPDRVNLIEFIRIVSRCLSLSQSVCQW